MIALLLLPLILFASVFSFMGRGLWGGGLWGRGFWGRPMGFRRHGFHHHHGRR